MQYDSKFLYDIYEWFRNINLNNYRIYAWLVDKCNGTPPVSPDAPNINAVLVVI